MCRFLAYVGTPQLLADLLYRPAHSIVKQSYGAREMDEALNGDGFGVGWYAPEIDPTPCVQRSVLPAWSSYNLQQLTAKIRARRVFAHVRAASPGMLVMESNTHPFSHDRLMWMHNGGVANFHRIRRKLRAGLKEEFENMIQGTTDSEHSFAVFLNALRAPFGELTAGDLRDAMAEMIARLNELTREAEISESSFYNFAVTDGKSVVVSRYCSAPGVKGRSLYYSRQALVFDARPELTSELSAAEPGEAPAAVIISSERLTDEADAWREVPDNHTVTVKEDLSVEVKKLDL